MKEELRNKYFKNYDRDIIRGQIIFHNIMVGHPELWRLTHLSEKDGRLGKAIINITNTLDFSIIEGLKVEHAGKAILIKKLVSVSEMEVKAFMSGEVSRGGKYRLTFPLYEAEVIGESSDFERGDLLSFNSIMDSYVDTIIVPKMLGLPPHYGILSETVDLKPRAIYSEDSEAKEILQKIKDIADETLNVFDNLELGEAL